MSAERPALRALAARLGVVDAYHDVEGREVVTSDATREALVAAMGSEAASEDAAERALSALARADVERLIEPVLVWREWGSGRPATSWKPAAFPGARHYRIVLRLEDGGQVEGDGELPDPEEHDPRVWRSIPLPLCPPFGYHELSLELSGPGGSRSARQRFVMAPRTAFSPEEALAAARSAGHDGVGSRAFGLWTNLYAVRGRAGYGHGNLSQLAALARFTGRQGGAFVGLNPLHAVTNRGLDFAPYSPTSRLYRNVLYLDPEAVPELAESESCRRMLADEALLARRAALESAAQIDHAAVLALLRPIFAALHEVFSMRHRGRATMRGRAYADYCEREGPALLDFATWEAIAESRSAPGAPPDTRWWRWPGGLRNVRSPEVEAFRRAHRPAIDLCCWLQFELDRQLREAGRVAVESGCAMGLYQDLALGSSRASADVWMRPALHASGVQVGAPPDAYAPDGQDWGFPPLDPHALRRDGYRYWSSLLAASFAGSGAIRLDHAMGLMRLFWIPEGRSGRDGAYVTYRADELLGVLALESRRACAVVVAEDLGTVPAELRSMLADWGLLRSAVLYFEHDTDGAYRPSSSYPVRALASIGTHDLPPLAGIVAGADLSLRQRVGHLGVDVGIDRALADRARSLEALRARLRAEGLLPALPAETSPEPAPPRPEQAAAALLRALHTFLVHTPSLLVAVSLDDLAGESEPVNLPGVPPEVWPSWSRRMTRSLEALIDADDVLHALEPLESLSSHRPEPAGRANAIMEPQE